MQTTEIYITDAVPGKHSANQQSAISTQQSALSQSGLRRFFLTRLLVVPQAIENAMGF
jgi:hypothetical protein